VSSAKHKKTRAVTSTTTAKSVTKPATTTTTANDATLAMVPNGDTWVCVENAAGTTLYTGTYRAGETIQTVHGATLLVALGNNEVTITADGRPYTPSTSSAIGLKITPKGVSSLATLPRC